MTTRLLSSLFALSLALPASAQFVETERTFHVKPEGHANVHTLSLPDPVEVSDIANSANPDACDLSSMSADGVVNADDILCMLWGGGDDAERHGAMALIRLDDDLCVFEQRTAFRPAAGAPLRFIGSAFEYQPDEGYWVQAFPLPGQPDPVNLVTLRSRCNLSLASVPVTRRCPFLPLTLPHDPLASRGFDLLCGLEGVDWEDLDDDGYPDTCAGGLFDPVSGVTVTLQTVTEDGVFSSCSAYQVGEVRFIGSACDQEWPVTDAVLVNLNTGYQPREWAPPTRPCP